eukprot:3537147-Pleurochrysis_carterae.AAC.1
MSAICAAGSAARAATAARSMLVPCRACATAPSYVSRMRACFARNTSCAGTCRPTASWSVALPTAVDAPAPLSDAPSMSSPCTLACVSAPPARAIYPRLYVGRLRSQRARMSQVVTREAAVAHTLPPALALLFPSSAGGPVRTRPAQVLRPRRRCAPQHPFSTRPCTHRPFASASARTAPSWSGWLRRSSSLLTSRGTETASHC